MTFLPDNILRLMDKKDRPKGKAGKTLCEIFQENEKKSEKEIQKDIIGFLRLRNIVPIHQRMDRRTTTATGTPDVLFAYHGIPFAWEIKTEKGKLRAEQEELHPRLEANGWRVSVVRSIQQAKEILDSIPDLVHQGKA